MANSFNAQYTPTVKVKSDHNTKMKHRRNLRKIKAQPSDPKITITTTQVSKAIKKSKNSKALGPDEISPIMLKHLGPKAINYLTNIYNHCVNQAIIPSVWKTGRVIPLLKPGKKADEGSSYRPISLLSPAAKILESVLLPELATSIPLADHQHGFRKGHSTQTALQTISHHVTTGLNIKPPVRRTVAVAIDLSKAFDTVSHEQLIEDILNLNLNGHIKRFLTSYIRGRMTFVEFRGRKSCNRKMLQGVPQGGVLSPTLFNLYMCTMPRPNSNSNLVLITYADDTTILGSATTIPPICEELNPFLDILDAWFKKRNLFISPSKSSATLFTTFAPEAAQDLPIYIDGSLVPTVKCPKLLGVTLDPTWTFRSHVDELKKKLKTKGNALKALSGTSWGKEKEVMITTYKSVMQSNINYCAGIYSNNLCDTKMEELQRIQNAALRDATGCHKKTNISHLHRESKMMPVKDHCRMLSKQFLLQTQQPTHPNKFDISERPHRHRQMKKTLQSEFGTEISNMIPNTGLTPDTYKFNLKQIHRNEVQNTINNLDVNPVLGIVPPEVHQSERQLPRSTRSTLCQLRSKHSIYLNSYLRAIQKRDDDLCPKCNAAPHTSNHLFDCPANPTVLDVTSLWKKPLEAARFLDLQSEEDLQDPG